MSRLLMVQSRVGPGVNGAHSGWQVASADFHWQARDWDSELMAAQAMNHYEPESAAQE
jgi:hypothetical protein